MRGVGWCRGWRIVALVTLVLLLCCEACDKVWWQARRRCSRDTCAEATIGLEGQWRRDTRVMMHKGRSSIMIMVSLREESPSQ